MKLKTIQRTNRRCRPGRAQLLWNVLTGKWGKQHRLPAHVTGEADWEVEVPQIRMSRAFAVMLVLHIVAVGGLFAFRIWGRDAEKKEAAATEVTDGPTPGHRTGNGLTGSQPGDIPAPQETPSEPTKTYVWHAGDTLPLVAARFKISGSTLRDANLDKELIPGTEIMVPRPGRIIGAGDLASAGSQPAEIFDPLAPNAKEEPAPVVPPRAEEVPEYAGGATAPEVPVNDNLKQTTARKVSMVTPAKTTPGKPAGSRVAETTTSKTKTGDTAGPKAKLAEATPPKSKLKPAELAVTKPKPKTTEAETPARSAGQRAHVVTKGDTVYNVAKRYGFTAAEIAKANSLNSEYRIQLGQTLRIPVRR